MFKSFISILILSLSLNYAYAFSCFTTIAKEDCWLNYNVSINVLDAANNKVLTTVIVPQGQSWARLAFECNPGTTLAFEAKFNPVFWQGDEDKVYPGQSYWQLPKTAKATEAAWNLNICFPQRFAKVPMPPEAKGKCACDMNKIPPIPAQ